MIGRGRDLSAPRDQMELTVKAHDPVRLDLYLREALVWKSRKRIQGLIRGGHVMVNGRPAKPSQGVRGGDRIQVRLSMGTGLPSDIGEREVPVIYEDRWILAVDKPPGMLVHPVGRHVYDTLMNYLHFQYRGGAPASRPEEGAAGAAADPPSGCAPDGGPMEAAEAGGMTGPARVGWKDPYSRKVDEDRSLRLCHRIDKDTTGIVLVAKESHVHREIGWQFQHRKVSKEYLTLTLGSIPAGITEVDLPIGEGSDLEEALAPPLRPARTLIGVLGEIPSPSGQLTLVAARPVTGRQNQIRVHLAAIGHPIVGDTRYGGGPAAPPEGFPRRYLLHARRLRIFHPRLKSFLELDAPPPQDFAQLLEGCRL